MQSNFHSLIISLRIDLDNLVDELVNKKITLDEFETYVLATLEDGYKDVSVLGRLLAGNKDNSITQYDETLASNWITKQSVFLKQFVNSMKEKDKRYIENDEYKKDNISSRLVLYTMQHRTAANESWVYNLENSIEIYWKMSGFEHCKDCPILQYESSIKPFTKATLYTLPGLDTECEMRCTCYLETTDGQKGFTFV